MSDQQQQLIMEDPPASRRGATHAGRGEGTLGFWLSEIRDAKVVAPEWVKFPQPRNATYVTKIKQGAYSATAPGEFEVLSRKVDADGERAPDRKVWLYARLASDA